MDNSKPLLERALEIARSGSSVGLGELRKQLRLEGYARSEFSVLDGLGLRRQLKLLCDEANCTRENAE